MPLGHRGGQGQKLTSLQCCSLSRSRRVRLVSSNVLSFCRRSSFCLVRVLMSVQVICFSWKTAGRPYKVQREKGGRRGGRPLLRGAGARKSREKAPSCVRGRRWGGRGSRAGFPEQMDPGWEQVLSQLRATSGEKGWGLRVGKCSQGWLPGGSGGRHLVADTCRNQTVADTCRNQTYALTHCDPRRPMTRSPQRPWPPEVILKDQAPEVRVGVGAEESLCPPLACRCHKVSLMTA